MSLAPGTQLGPYKILAPLGAGGMGEVYRAHDTRLGRNVAIKVLTTHLSANPEVRARFEREARTISQLNHPHICTLYDIGRQDDIDYLVMELVEGETLAARLEKGPLSLPETLKLGTEIAEALDRAHRSGIVHRDLKPGNVMLTKSGAKLMDFGLARATHLAPVAGALTESPTASRPLTAEGTIVGTFQYMAPEQLEGREADARTDIFAFGAVLYEMITGRRAFEGRSQASLIAAILATEPKPVSSIQPMTPPAIDRVVRTCLAKDPEERWQSARDLSGELRWIAASDSEQPRPAPRKGRRRERLAWAVAGMMALAALFAASVLLWRGGTPGTSGPTRVHTAIFHEAEGNIDSTPSNMAISPDGRRVAYVVDENQRSFLWVRDLDSQSSRRLSDLDSAALPFWSPDGRWIAFFTQAEPARLWKVPAGGGAPISLCSLTLGVGGSWGKGDVIVFAPTASGPLYRVPASGGTPEPVTTLDATRNQTGHRMPWFLPDGVHFLFATLPRVGADVETFAGSLTSKEVKRVLAAASGVTYAEPGYLLFERDRRLVAQRFDASRLELAGEPVPIADSPLAGSSWEATWIATASLDGRLATLQSRVMGTDVEWVDRTGRLLGRLPLPAGRWHELALSPDGGSVLATRGVGMLSNELWLFDSEGSRAERISSPDENINGGAIWAPDGRSFLYSSAPSGPFEIYRQEAGRAHAPRMVPTGEGQFKVPVAFAPDGTTLLVAAHGPASRWNVWLNPLRGGGPATLLLRGAGAYIEAAVSPDGRYLAYTSYEMGKQEIYVTSFPAAVQRVRISTRGGMSPRWNLRAGELLYLASPGPDSGLMSVQVATGTEFTAGPPRPLLTRPGIVSYTATPDGERLLLSVESRDAPPPRIGLILNWTSGLENR